MRFIPLYLLLIVCITLTANSKAESGKQMAAAFEEKYPFFTMKDTAFTFNSEFNLPDGYRYMDSTELTSYQYWISGFPLWHRYKPVGIWKGGKRFEADEVSRVVNLPWKGQNFDDVGFPIYILAEYLRHLHRESELAIIPRLGDTLDYPTWLHSKFVLTGLGAVKLIRVEQRDTSVYEYYKLLDIMMRHSIYKSLTANVDSIPIENIAPGDLLIGHDKQGRKGSVYFVMNMIINKSGEKLYCVATGCPEACDFHIPLMNLNRDNPWIDANRLQELISDYPFYGAFRWRIP